MVIEFSSFRFPLLVLHVLFSHHASGVISPSLTVSHLLPFAGVPPALPPPNSTRPGRSHSVSRTFRPVWVQTCGPVMALLCSQPVSDPQWDIECVEPPTGCHLRVDQVHDVRHPAGRGTQALWSDLVTWCMIASCLTFCCDLCPQGILGFRLQGPDGQGVSVDASSLPLVIYVLSAVTYLSCRWANQI